jgi:hypothetical protein
MSIIGSRLTRRRAARFQSEQKYVLFLLMLAALTIWRVKRINYGTKIDATIATSDLFLLPMSLWKDTNAAPNKAALQMANENSTVPSATRANKNISILAPPPIRASKATIAYAISVTDCKNPLNNRLVDGAAVLKHSIHLASIRNPSGTSRYDYHTYAFVHPNATQCSSILERAGYTVQMRDTPIDTDDINNTAYAERLNNPNSGCCGAREFLKLYSYTLLEYPVVVHLDVDVVILKPLDELFDIMLQPANATKHVKDAMWNKTVAHSIDSMFTRDYPMSNSVGNPNKVGMQGGFWLVRPNLTIYDEYRQIILRGDFVPGAGWGGAEYRYGGFYGAAQIQGIVPYFYGRFHPQTFVELNRCVYNQMVDIPYHEKYGKCLTGEEICQDCREANVEDIYSAHFTLCGKPWTCPSIEQHSNKSESYKWMEKVSLVGNKGELCSKSRIEALSTFSLALFGSQLTLCLITHSTTTPRMASNPAQSRSELGNKGAYCAGSVFATQWEYIRVFLWTL